MIVSIQLFKLAILKKTQLLFVATKPLGRVYLLTDKEFAFSGESTTDRRRIL